MRRQRRDDDLVEAAQVDGIVDGRHRVGISDEPLDRGAGRIAQLRQRIVENLLRLAGALVLGVDDPVQAVRGVGYEQRERARSTRCASCDRVEQRLGRGRLVGNDSTLRRNLRMTSMLSPALLATALTTLMRADAPDGRAAPEWRVLGARAGRSTSIPRTGPRSAPRAARTPRRVVVDPGDQSAAGVEERRRRVDAGDLVDPAFQQR